MRGIRKAWNRGDEGWFRFRDGVFPGLGWGSVSISTEAREVRLLGGSKRSSFPNFNLTSMSSDSTPVTVVALMRAQPGKEHELRQALSSLVAPTRKEAGCLNYDLHQSPEDPTRFMFHENWTSKADLDRHLGSAHVTAVLSKLGGLVAEPPQITLWRKIG